MSGEVERERILKELKKRNSIYREIVVGNDFFAGLCIEKNLKIPAVLEDMAQIVGTEVEIVNPEINTIVDAFDKASVVMLTDGRIIAAGRNHKEAETAFDIFSKCAEVFVKADRIGGYHKIPDEIVKGMRETYLYSYSKPELMDSSRSSQTKTANECLSENHSELEYREKRTDLVNFGNRLSKIGLVQGTWGNLSVRIDDKWMLVTPSGIPYDKLTPEDMVKVDIETLEYEGSIKPTSEKSMHAKIYDTRNDVGAIIHTHSKYASVFAAAKKKLGDIPATEYAQAGSDELTLNVAQALSSGGHAVFITNHGMVAAGKNLQDALNICIEVEENAEKSLKAFE